MIKFTGHSFKNRLPNHISFLSLNKNNKPIPGRLLVKELSKRGVYCSSGSACSSLTGSDSRVLKALNIPNEFLASGVRISIGSWITKNDIEVIPKMIIDSILSINNHQSH